MLGLGQRPDMIVDFSGDGPRITHVTDKWTISFKATAGEPLVEAWRRLQNKYDGQCSKEVSDALDTATKSKPAPRDGFAFTKHVLERMKLRGISFEWALQAATRPDYRETTREARDKHYAELHRRVINAQGDGIATEAVWCNLIIDHARGSW
jgi:hypothetical protein